LITVKATTGFDLGSTVTQGSVTGTVIAMFENDLLVKVDGYDKFKCSFKCSELQPISTVTDDTTYSTSVTKITSLGAIFDARSLAKYRDIDKTIDTYVNEFKKKYLRNVDFDALSNKKLFVKNALSFYRSKGTDRNIDLFFRLVYGTNAEVERPADYLFQASEAKWSKPTYLEISPDTVDRAISLIGKEITGVTSGAKAFVEKYVKLKTNFGFSHVLFVSNVKGNFIVKELIKDKKVFADSPSIYGSLTSVTITSPTFTFKVGDLVPLETFTGINGLGRVSEIRFATGQVEFELEDGGYGFTPNAINPDPFASKTYVADHLISLSNVQLGNVVSTAAVTAPGSGYTNGDTVTFLSDFGRPAYGTIVTNASGAVVDVEVRDQGSGYFEYIVNTVNVTTSTGNGLAQILGVTDYSTQYVTLLEPIYQEDNPENPSGFVLSIPTSLSLSLTAIQGAFVEGDTLYQTDPSQGVVARGIISRAIVNLNTGTISLRDITGAFRTNLPVFSSRPETTAIIASVNDLQFSIKLDGFDRFVANDQFLVVANTSGMKGTAFAVSSGVSANVFITAIEDTETVIVNSDTLAGVDLDTPLDALAFNLPQDPAANIGSFLIDSLAFESIELGKIRSLGLINPGNNYNVSPEVLIIQPYIAGFDKNDLIFNIKDLDGAFAQGELIQQTYDELTYVVSVSNTEQIRTGESVFATNTASETVLTGVVSEISSGSELEIQGLELANSNPLSVVGTVLRSETNPSLAQTILAVVATQQTRIARARVKSFDTETLQATRLSFSDTYKVGESFFGQISGVSANVVSFSEDESTRPIGVNANVSTITITGDGTVANLEVIDSGFGFVNGQEATFLSPQGREGRFIAINGGLGTGSGSYESIKGFPSDRSKLFDGNYYQEYSYDIMSKIPIAKYASMFKEVLHTAGTQFFGTVLIDTTIKISDANREATSEVIVTDVAPGTVYSVDIDGAPEPWGSVTTDPSVRSDLLPVVDVARINIETRT
jgi:hypothetical protein